MTALGALSGTISYFTSVALLNAALFSNCRVSIRKLRNWLWVVTEPAHRLGGYVILLKGCDMKAGDDVQILQVDCSRFVVWYGPYAEACTQRSWKANENLIGWIASSHFVPAQVERM